MVRVHPRSPMYARHSLFLLSLAACSGSPSTPAVDAKVSDAAAVDAPGIDAAPGVDARLVDAAPIDASIDAAPTPATVVPVTCPASGVPVVMAMSGTFSPSA